MKQKLLTALLIGAMITGGIVTAQEGIFNVATDDFEDAELTVDSDNWSGWDTSVEGRGTVPSETDVSSKNAISGVFSVRINSSDGDNGGIEIDTNSSDLVSEIEFKMNRSRVNIGGTGGGPKHSHFRLRNTTDSSISILVQARPWSQGSCNLNDCVFINILENGESNTLIRDDQNNVASFNRLDGPMDIRIFNIDYTNETFSMDISDDTQSYTRHDLPFYQDDVSAPNSFFLSSQGSADDFFTTYVDDFSMGARSVDSNQENYTLDITEYMEHDTSQNYRLLYNGNDITDNANISSSNTSIISVDEANNQLRSTSDTSVSGISTITASYNGTKVSAVNVTVANATLDNIAILPSNKWVGAFFGFYDDGTTYVFGSQIQWVFVAILIGAGMGSIQRNEYVATGAITGLLILFWVLGHIDIAFPLTGIFIALFVAYQARETEKAPQVNMNIDSYKFR